ncbi:hypothetical protein OAH23_08970 [Verrucomicrobia bacterium]|nr:hypothetical protein [Verrucomicrobiota bacterium]MDB4717930.1 hypothetical protein [Verrucomicrobiota bacterium]
MNREASGGDAGRQVCNLSSHRTLESCHVPFGRINDADSSSNMAAAVLLTRLSREIRPLLSKQS